MNWPPGETAVHGQDAARRPQARRHRRAARSLSGEKNPDLPEWFVHIVDKLLAKKPEDRYQSAREVANTLEQFWVLLKSSDTIKCPKKKAADLRRSIVVGTLAGLATLLVGGLAAFFLLPHRDRPEDRIPMPLHVFKGGTSGALWSLDVSKDGTHITTGTDDGTVKLWDIAGEKVAWTLPAAHKAPVWALALSPSGVSWRPAAPTMAGRF